MSTPLIIFEDSDMLVLSKPSGMTVNRADTTTGETTLQDFVEEYLHLPKGEPRVSDTYNAEEVFRSRAGIVHRLDKETSGVILIAKTVDSFQKLQAQFKERTVKKVYTALAHGKVEPQEGEINAPIGRLPWNRMRFGVIADGREAVTKFKVQSLKFKVGNEPLTLLELFPETGRTHQIRVHLKHINHPIFGDFLYAGRKTARDDRKILERVFLHASKISFSHPVSGEALTFDCPLTEELQGVLKHLSADMKDLQNEPEADTINR